MVKIIIDTEEYTLTKEHAELIGHLIILAQEFPKMRPTTLLQESIDHHYQKKNVDLSQYTPKEVKTAVTEYVEYKKNQKNMRGKSDGNKKQ